MSFLRFNILKTSNFSNSERHNLKGISISRFPPKWIKKPYIVEFTPLMPSQALLYHYGKGLDWEDYSNIYREQLACLDCQKVWNKLVDLARVLKVPEPILICYESAKTLDTKPCHRRLVAQWFEENLNVKVEEWTPN